MFAGFLGRRFHEKCKSAIKPTMARTEIVRKRRKAMQNFLSNDIAELLKGGFDTNAYSKAEGLCAELNKISCYDFIDQFCGCILDHLPAMQKESECPKESREAVASLIFAAARMADVPELRELRNILTERYGNAMESFANKEFVETMKSKSASKDMKLQLLQDIAQLNSIEWDSKALEQKLFNPPATDEDQKKKTSTKKEYDVPKDHTEKEDDAGDGNAKDKQGFLSHETPSFEGNGGHQDFSSIEKRVPVKEKDDRRPFTEGIVPPPYTRPKAGKTRDSDALHGGEVDNKPGKIPVGTNGPEMEEVAGKLNAQVGEEESKLKPRELDDKLERIPAGTNLREKEEEAEKLNAQVGEGESKPKPRSVRRRQRHMPAGHDQSDIQVETNPRRTRLEDPRRGLQILNPGDQHQNDEEQLDRLLVHYSRKKQIYEPSPPLPLPPQQSAAENCKPEYRHHPSRVRSLPSELTNPSDQTIKGHARASSFQPHMLKSSHVHPKLPDYDEIAARLAALRGK